MGTAIVEPGGDLACLPNSQDLSSFQGKEVSYGGRLVWSHLMQVGVLIPPVQAVLKCRCK